MDQLNVEDTIVAQATAREPGFCRGIIRLAGDDTLEILNQCVDQKDRLILKNTQVASQLDIRFDVPDFDLPVPVDLLYWPDSRSYTRQPAAEIHAFGSLPLLDSMVNQLCAAGARLAQPGEFTMRAFLSGRMDLTEAEAVLGVIDAHDKKQLNVALEQLSGGISKPLHQAREELLHSLANLEAGLDFVEEDIEFVSEKEMKAMIDRCLKELQVLEKQIELREPSVALFRVVLFGKPNTGKSSLFNSLVQAFGDDGKERRRSAIVSSESGTTTDFVSATIMVEGFQIELMDTAGIDETGLAPGDGSALALGQGRSQEKRDSADLTLFCLDASQPVSSWEKEKMAELNEASIVCFNKSDQAQPNEMKGFVPFVQTSSLTGQGIKELGHRIGETFKKDSQSETVLGTAVRCTQSVKSAIDALKRADELVENGIGEEFVANELRLALDAIGKITGVIYTDDILDVVFKQFCIGK